MTVRKRRLWMESVEKILERFKAAKANKQLWENHLRECYEYAMPERNTIDQWSPGAKKRSRVFDDTAQDALEDFANRMTALLVPANTEWIKLEAGTDIPENAQEKANKYLEETTKTFYNHLNSSNFTSQISEAMLDLGISTGAIIVEEGDGIQSSLNYRAVSLSELILERSSRGIVDTVFREFKIPARDLEASWKGLKLTDTLKEIVLKKPDTDIELIEAVVKDKNIYRSIVLYLTEKALLQDVEIDFNPYIVFRESTIPGEVYGRGRVMRQLNNIKTLNRMIEDYLKGLSFQANPIFTATDDGVINPYTIKLRPGVVAPVGSNDNVNPTLRALALSGNPQLMEFAVSKYQEMIRRALLSKPFGSIEDTPVRSATEMSIRNADQAQTTYASSSRIQSELLERIVAASLYILKKAGKVADFKVNGREVALKFVNPATRQQDEATLAAFGRFSEFMQVFPLDVVAQKLKIEDMPVEIYETLGLPMKLKRDDDEVAAMQAQQAQQAQAQIEAGTK